MPGSGQSVINLDARIAVMDITADRQWSGHIVALKFSSYIIRIIPL